MSMMKRYCEEVSVDMGLDGEITDEVMVEAQQRLDAGYVGCVPIYAVYGNEVWYRGRGIMGRGE